MEIVLNYSKESHEFVDEKMDNIIDYEILKRALEIKKKHKWEEYKEEVNMSENKSEESKNGCEMMRIVEQLRTSIKFSSVRKTCLIISGG